jgi:hypothetical protein
MRNTRPKFVLIGALVLALAGAGGMANAGALSTVHWTHRHPATSPPARGFSSVVTDPATGKVLLFGGADGTTFFRDTWLWDGTNWHRATPATRPPAVAAAAAADTANGTVVLLAGDFAKNGVSDTWTWNGSNWTKHNPVTHPPGRNRSQMATDPVTGHVVLFGGFDPTTGTVVNDTWTFDGTNWTRLTPRNRPPARDLAGMATDTATGRIVLFGGIDAANSFLNDTWTWNGSNWTKQHPAASPSVRSGAGMAADRSNGRVLLFGGTYQTDTWSWNGTTWVDVSPATSPPGRAFVDMATDPAGRVVLFGGQPFTGPAKNDTWSVTP